MFPPKKANHCFQYKTLPPLTVGSAILKGVWRTAAAGSWAANVQRMCTKWGIDIMEENLTGVRRNEWWTVLKEKAQVQAVAEIQQGAWNNTERG